MTPTRLHAVASSPRAVLQPEVGEVLVGADELQRRVSELGEEISRDYAGRSLLLVGERIWNLERLFNNAAGLTRNDDSLPPRMLKEPLGEGPSKGHVVPLEIMLDEYYRERGWDAEGRPTPERLKMLNLGA